MTKIQNDNNKLTKKSISIQHLMNIMRHGWKQSKLNRIMHIYNQTNLKKI